MDVSMLSNKETLRHLNLSFISDLVSVVPAETGQHLDIICRYKNDLKNNVKFICKGSDPSLCKTSGIKVSSETNSNGRFSLRDDQSAGVFTVTITDLTLEDSGIYWCGAAETRLKIKWISVTELKIHEVTSERTSAKPTTTASKHSTKPASKDGTSIRTAISSTSSQPLPASSSLTSPSPQLQLGVQMKGVVHVSGENLLTEEATQTVCHYEEIICTNNSAGYSLGLPVFGEHDAFDTLTYSTAIYQTTDHSDRTLLGQELWAIVSPGPYKTEGNCSVMYLDLKNF
ncbi:CMRF35-like molecule 6 [Pseudorasbora parva]|uniref:CMRF35-like molecule 6 n=1 Tax=Pseudorasbora parva TaxID=51549 RepID=UPI00351F680B